MQDPRTLGQVDPLVAQQQQAQAQQAAWLVQQAQQQQQQAQAAQQAQPQPIFGQPQPQGIGLAQPAAQPAQAQPLGAQGLAQWLGQRPPAQPQPRAPQAAPEPQQEAQSGLMGALPQGQPQGIGLAQQRVPQGMFGSPARAMPEDLSDLSPLQDLWLRFGNMAHIGAVQAPGGGGGGMRPSDQMIARRQLGNDRRVLAFREGIGLVQNFEQMLARQRPEDLPGAYAIVRRQFGDLAGGDPQESGEFIDAFLSAGPGRARQLLAIAKQSPEIAQAVASGESVEQILARASKLTDQGIIFSDREELGPLRERLAATMRGENLEPEQYKAIQKTILPSGRYSPRRVMDAVPDLFDLHDREVVMRNINEFADLGFTPDKDFADYQNLGARAHLGIGTGSRAGARPRRASVSQYKAARYGDRALSANNIIDELETDGWDASKTLVNSRVGEWLPTKFRSAEQQRFDAATRAFITGMLRLDSGMLIKDSEQLSEVEASIPRYGDLEPVLEDKRARRKALIERMKAEAGEAWGIPESAPAEYSPELLDRYLGPATGTAAGGYGGGAAVGPPGGGPPPGGYGGRFGYGPGYGGPAAEAMFATDSAYNAAQAKIDKDRSELEGHRQKAGGGGGGGGVLRGAPGPAAARPAPQGGGFLDSIGTWLRGPKPLQQPQPLIPEVVPPGPGLEPQAQMQPPQLIQPRATPQPMPVPTLPPLPMPPPKTHAWQQQQSRPAPQPQRSQRSAQQGRKSGGKPKPRGAARQAVIERTGGTGVESMTLKGIRYERDPVTGEWVPVEKIPE